MNALDLLAALPVMLWTARADGVWTHVNRRWTAYTGIQGDASRFGFEGALHPDDVAPTVARWIACVRTGEEYQAEYRVRRADGEYRWFLTHGVHTPELDADVRWTGTCTDIHDQKQAERDATAARQSAVRALGLALEARDHGTKGHTDRVTALALQLGQQAGLTGAELDSLQLGAYLHDIGKMGVPDAVLLNPGHLTAAERAVMQQHVWRGEQFAASLGFLSEDVLALIRGHHERWDGSGYPDGRRGTEIPLLARIFAIADVYDALVSERPYKQAWAPERAWAEIAAQAGQQFDPWLTRLFTGLLQEGAAPLEDPPPLHRPAVNERLLARALHEAAISVLITDAEQRLIYVNPAFCQRSGYTPDEVLGQPLEFVQEPALQAQSQRLRREVITTDQPVHQLLLTYTKSGEELWVDLYLTPLLLDGTQHFVAVQHDSSVQVADHRRLQELATHDPLTGLLNRLSLKSVLDTCQAPSVLISLDLDHFKGINDRSGHRRGDEVLQAVARLLATHTPQGAQLFRLGGDEFLIVLPGEPQQEANDCVTELRTALATVDTGDGPLTASVGLAFFPQEGHDLWALMNLADERLYRDKADQDKHRTAGKRATPLDG